VLGVEDVVIEGADLEGDDLVVSVRLRRRQRNRCGRCGQRCPGYDAGEDRRRWRALDLGTTRAYLEAAAPRVHCRTHGVVVGQVPWAGHDARFTRRFEEQTAWLAVECSKTAVAALMRISWRSIGPLLVRVTRRLLQGQDRLAGLRRIGIDEISFRKGQRYLVVVVDHDRQRLVWARAGATSAPCGASSMNSDRSAVQRSPTSVPTRPAGLPMWWRSAVHRRSVASIPFRWWPGRPKPWMRSAVRSGTPPGAAGRRTTPAS